jgi:hypothetical protein
LLLITFQIVDKLKDIDYDEETGEEEDEVEKNPVESSKKSFEDRGEVVGVAFHIADLEEQLKILGTDFKKLPFDEVKQIWKDVQKKDEENWAASIAEGMNEDVRFLISVDSSFRFIQI